MNEVLTGSYYDYDKYYKMELMRISANIYFTDILSLIIGRQNTQTGYGYGWNPIDFANPLKDPINPEEDLIGVDAATLQFSFGKKNVVNIFGMVPEPEDWNFPGFELENLKIGSEISLVFPFIELKFTGLWDNDGYKDDSNYTSAVGVALKMDFFDIGIYGEGAVLAENRIRPSSGVLFAGLLGINYTFEAKSNLILEYFYNGEGRDRDERLYYQQLVRYDNLYEQDSNSSEIQQVLDEYTLGRFAKHYILFHLIQPIHSANTDVEFSILYSPDSEALSLFPSINYTFSENFSANIEYNLMFDLNETDFDEVNIDENEFNEITALESRQNLNIGFTYHF